MSESSANACKIAAGDSAEVNTDVQNSELLAACKRRPSNESAQAPVCQVSAAGGDNPLPDKDNNANTKESAEANNNDSNTMMELQEEISKRIHERDDFRKKFEDTERKLSILQSSIAAIGPNAGGGGVADPTTTTTPPPPPSLGGADPMRRELELLRAQLAQTKRALEDRRRQSSSQEEQIAALNKQVSSLKEVVSITKDMLNIRNMEVKHLQEDVDKMEGKIVAERERHNTMIGKMDAAVRLNADLKREYQAQLRLFQELRGKYEEKVTLLSEENKALESAVQAQPAQ